MPFLCGFESLFLKGPPPTYLGVWHMVCGTDGCAAIQLVRIWRSCSAVPAAGGQKQPGLWSELIPPSCYARESGDMLLFTSFPSKPF